ncbi:MAG: glycosyltransferase family 2 protein [Trichloromonadaceae bacterium]
MADLVSIVIAGFNYGRYLPEAIESALNQSYKAIEVIYIDDGSTDDSLEIAQRYPITVLAQENQWVAAARNNAVEFAKGKYIFFLDADDLLQPQAIEHCLQLMADSPPGVGYIYGQMEYFEYKQGFFASREFSPRDLARSNYICVSSLLRREDFLRVGGFDRAMVEGREDWDLYVRLLHHGVHGRFLPEPLIRCRKHRPPRKKLINQSKNMAAAKLFYKYPKFFWRSFCRRPMKFIYCLLFGGIGGKVCQYGPNPDRRPHKIDGITH